MKKTITKSIFDPDRWGIPSEEVKRLGNRLYNFWIRFRGCFKTKTRDTSEYAHAYLSGQLRMETDRNFANIGRKNDVPEQNMQHFMSNSPWKASSVFEQVQLEIKETPRLQKGNGLILDECGDEKAGDKNAGSGRQYLGRYGKVDMGQVGTFLSIANITGKAPFWTWVDAELYFQEHWFEDEMKEVRDRLGIPEDRKFMTKIELGWKMIQRCMINGLPFEFVGCDALYGNSSWFRSQMRLYDITYMADVSNDTQVYLNKPVVGVPESRPGKRGPKPKNVRVLSEEKPVKVSSLVKQLEWETIKIRNTERGILKNKFAAKRVYLYYEEEKEVVEEWLVIRLDSSNKYTYSLSNGNQDLSLKKMATQKCMRYFVERSNQDARSEAGWDEFQAQQFSSWEHHTAFCVLASWFMAQTRLEWAEQHSHDADLARKLETDILPFLSFSNIRELLRAVIPLPKLTPDEAIKQTIKHLLNRTYSRKSRMRKINEDDNENFASFLVM